jgi:hypothetical protein
MKNKEIMAMTVASGAGRKEFTESFGSFPYTQIVGTVKVNTIDAGSSLREELAKIKVHATLKNPNHQDITLMDDVSLLQVCLLSDFQGGSSLDAIETGSAPYTIPVLLSTGSVVLNGQDEAVYKMIYENPLANFDVKLTAFSMMIAPENIIVYKAFASNGQSIREPDVMQVFNTTDADGKSVTFVDQEGSEMIVDYDAQALANTLGRVETFESSIGLLYNDRHMIGQDLEIKVPTGCELLFVESCYPAGRERTIDNMQAKRNALLAEIKISDPEKYYKLVS